MPPAPGDKSRPATRTSTFQPGCGLLGQFKQIRLNPTKSNRIKLNQTKKTEESIIARRREIQFAADAQWPASNPANAGIRREFRLPPDKAMK